MIDILLTTLPIYLLVLTGFAAVRVKYVEAEHIGALSQFVFRLCLPALVFAAVALPRSEGDLNIAFIAAYAGGSMLVMFLGYAALRLMMRQPVQDSWILAMGMSNSNSAYLGFPIASLFFGPDAAIVFAMTMIIENTLTLPFALIAASAAEGAREDLRAQIGKVLRMIFQNPLTIAVMAGLLVRLLGVPLFVPLQESIRLIGSITAPLALLLIGGVVATMPLSGHWRRAGAVMLGKLVLHPLVVAAMLFLVPGVPPALIPMGILFAAVPMMTVYPILAAPYGLSNVSSTALLVCTVVSALSVSLVLRLLIGV
ncbi:AEC family transporter [Pararhodobacter oceanensis]|uniref:AEC family transporter n=1 Tax=Pararhodobacter oceanensis TaxID=2172121 RepID=UPI003A945D5A